MLTLKDKLFLTIISLEYFVIGVVTISMIGEAKYNQGRVDAIREMQEKADKSYMILTNVETEKKEEVVSTPKVVKKIIKIKKEKE